MVERFPDLEVWVHARGAVHLADPTKLLGSAQRIYGDRLRTLFGRVLAVPKRNLRVLEGGETITVAGRELDVEYTPGHASHHVVYFDRGDGSAYVGDVAGVRIRPPTSSARRRRRQTSTFHSGSAQSTSSRPGSRRGWR